jgi:HEPN domain-containing protein
MTFFAEIERLDQEFSAVPLFIRQLDIYNALICNEERNDTTLGYLNKISAWYQQRYGQAAAWDGVIGIQPIYLRGRLFVFQIRCPEVNPKSGILDLRERLEREGPPVSPEEYRMLGVAQLESSSDFAALYNIEMRPSLFTKEQRALSRRAWFNLKNAVTLLESSYDIQGSIVDAHEAAEKFLKIALINEGQAYASLGKGDLRHDLNNLIKVLVKKHSKYKFIKAVARDLQQFFISMTTQRYESTNRSLPDAIEAFRLARHCCSFVAQQIELDSDRGASDVTLRIGKYYQDYAGRQYRFCGFENNANRNLVCKMFLLEASDEGQTIDALINQKAPCSFHYKEIKDQSTISRLERRYLSLRQRANSEKVAPRPVGVSIEQVHESLDGIFSIRIPIGKAPQK